MKDIKGYEGHYKINEKGEVFSFKNNRIRKLKPRTTHDGYVWYNLCLNGKHKTCRANRMVAEAFVPNPENKPTVNHIDGNKTNNNVENLEWATREEQMEHAYKSGLKKPVRGTLQGNSVLTEEQVKEIRSSYKPHSKEFGMRALAKKYNVSEPCILRCVRKVTYKNIE